MRILVIEDDELIAHALMTILTRQNYAVEVAADGQAGWELIEAFVYDMILLDVMLPKLDGISLCRQIRSKGLQMPILLLTGRDSSHDKAIGLDAGADDYVVKPFDQEELVARVRALFRRGGAIAQPVLEWGNLHLDPSSCEVTYGTKPLLLTPKEYALLELFLRNSRRVFSCGMILEHLWSYEETPTEEAVRTHIKGLRQKLRAAGITNDVVETVYGIGYRLKSQEQGIEKKKNKAGKGVATQDSLICEPTQQQILMLVGQVWQRFKERVGEQVAVLEQAVTALRQQELDQDLRQKARREAHTLAGSLGTFGLPEGSRLARKIEVTLQFEHSLSEDEAVNLQVWVMALRQEIERSPEADITPLSPSVLAEEDHPLLLIVDRDLALATTLIAEALTWGFRAEVASNLASAREQLFLQSPDAVLLDPTISHTMAESLSLLSELKKQVPPIPVIIFTEDDNLTTRLDFAHWGGSTFLQKSALPSQVMKAVNQALQQAEQAKARVMVVDDDLPLLAIVRSLLQPWGLQITTLSNPQQFWDVLETTSPDLLILDIEMPGISGIDLCQIVRNDSRWSGLPVMFLTAHTDADTINQVYAAGADDFVSKPIVGPELVTRIINRLERIRFLRNLAEIDPLTKVATRQKSTQDIETFLRLAKRQNQLFSLAVLDLDHFKQVNDRYGHATGDQVLQQIGKLLNHSFRSEDVVARWGGEEFLIGMYGMNKQDSVKRLTKVLENLRQQSFTALNVNQPGMKQSCQFQVTFSAGVAQYPDDGADLHCLYQAADTALYQAKAAGRDRVLAVATTKPSLRIPGH